MALLEGQTHRRVIKTHTPLDGVPLDDRVTYVVVGRHPLDVAVSLYHHSDNIDRRRMAELVGTARGPAATPPAAARVAARLRRLGGRSPRPWLDTLPGAMLHLSDAWARRHHGQRRARALRRSGHRPRRRHADGWRRRSVSPSTRSAGRRWSMPPPSTPCGTARLRPPRPASGVLKDPAAFFRRGVSGEGPALLRADELAHYYDRVADMAPADMLAWLHRTGDR